MLTYCEFCEVTTHQNIKTGQIVSAHSTICACTRLRLPRGVRNVYTRGCCLQYQCTSKENGLAEVTTWAANKSVKSLLAGEGKTSVKRPRKEQSVYSKEDQAAIVKYAAENEKTRAQKHFKSNYPELGKSTVRSFKQKDFFLYSSINYA